ncbi:MAG TPA: ribonuclease P protein subunit [Thermoplasmata archaeon]|uniref:Ribonuclease P protein component 1 n=1 Tax=uncultured euryarchaeote Rifle_16ft_4_minimus_37789 TaxID=1665195 RepID=A0A0H4T598_9EURY|nr:ribonuclease P, component 1, ribonuclease P protein subunit POP4 [uncultured euryarchaeote Rifle_16ft_4_minimus_37789]HKZ63685.1 ribonuclease P protein subunit [Thermoplasmata archaeon]
MNLRKHELIGLPVVVSASSDASLVGLGGVVVDETRNTLRVATPKGEKTVPKHGTQFTFDVQGGQRVAGDDLLFRPEDRIKKAR